MPKKPKTKPKTYPKNKRKIKPEPAPISITSRKSYWIILTVMMTIFGLGYGVWMEVAVPAIAILLASVLAVIVFRILPKIQFIRLDQTRKGRIHFWGRMHRWLCHLGGNAAFFKRGWA